MGAKKTSCRKERLAVILPDTHYPLHDPAAEACARLAIERIKPDTVIHLGDVGEWETVSHWRYERIKRPPLEWQIRELEPELAAVNAALDRLDASCSAAGVREKVITLGNHDDWLTRFVERHPYVPQYNPEPAMQLRRRGWRVYPFGEIARLGKLFFYHGHFYRNQHHAKTHAEKMGVSVIYGHHHDAQNHGVQHLSGTHRAWSIGCLRTMDADFLGGRPTNWSHNFAIVHTLPSGNFSVQVVDIIDGGAFVWGNLLEGRLAA